MEKWFSGSAFAAGLRDEAGPAKVQKSTFLTVYGDATCRNRYSARP